MSRAIFLLSLLALSFSVQAREIDLASKYDIDKTIDRYVQALKQAGIQVYDTKTFKNKITGNPEAEIVFANPLFGTRIGECHRGIRKDIPMVTKVWRDGADRVIVHYELPDPQINTFGVIECGNEVDNMSRALNGFAYSATE
jgi:hypothetical protein